MPYKGKFKFQLSSKCFKLRKWNQKMCQELTFIHFRTQTKIKWCTFQTPQNSYSYMHLPTVTKSKTGNFHHKNQHLYPFKICKHLPPANTSINWSPLPLPPRKPSSIWNNTSINWSPPTLPPLRKAPKHFNFWRLVSSNYHPTLSD